MFRNTSTYMKCGNVPLLWRIVFLNIAYNREHIFNYFIGPFTINFVESGI